MMVPELVAGEELHEANASLDQPPGNQAARAVLARQRVVEAVELLGRLALAADIQRLLRRRLHAGGEFVTRDPRFEVQLPGMPFQVLAVEAIEVRQVAFLGVALEMDR